MRASNTPSQATTLRTHNTTALHPDNTTLSPSSTPSRSHSVALSPPSTPSRSHDVAMARTHNAAPSTSSHAQNVTPLRTYNPMPTLTPVHLAILGSATTSSNISSSTTSSPSSMTLTADGSSGSRSPSLPSSQGSASRLASIIGALDELALDSPVPHYVVVRGISPGVYTTWCASTAHF